MPSHYSVLLCKGRVGSGQCLCVLCVRVVRHIPCLSPCSVDSRSDKQCAFTSPLCKRCGFVGCMTIRNEAFRTVPLCLINVCDGLRLVRMAHLCVQNGSHVVH